MNELDIMVNTLSAIHSPHVDCRRIYMTSSLLQLEPVSTVVLTQYKEIVSVDVLLPC